MSSCDSNPKKCSAQMKLYDILKDPIIDKIVNPRQLKEDVPDASTGLEWVNIPTTTWSGLYVSRDKLKKKSETVSFLALKKYNSEESKGIYNALKKSITNGGLSEGTGIIFDNQGNFSYIKKWENEDFENVEESIILRNPIIPAGSAQKSNYFSTESYMSNSVNAKNREFLPKDQSNGVFYYNTKIISNPILTYFIYTKDTTPTEDSIYYLLYNPMHREKFQRYYTYLLEYEGTWKGNDLVKPGSSGGYQNNDIVAVEDKSDDSKIKTARGFKRVISRYCNAIKLNGGALSNGGQAQHYADPTCNFLLGPEDANLSMVLGQNLTQENWAYEKYRGIINDTDKLAHGEFKKYVKLLLDSPGNRAIYFPCKTQQSISQKTSIMYAFKKGLIGDKSNSLANVLANAFINNIGVGVTTALNALNVTGKDFKKGPSCKATVQSITNCQTLINNAGASTANQYNINTACGGNKKEEEINLIAEEEHSAKQESLVLSKEEYERALSKAKFNIEDLTGKDVLSYDILLPGVKEYIDKAKEKRRLYRIALVDINDMSLDSDFPVMDLPDIPARPGTVALGKDDTSTGGVAHVSTQDTVDDAAKAAREAAKKAEEKRKEREEKEKQERYEEKERRKKELEELKAELSQANEGSDNTMLILIIAIIALIVIIIVGGLIIFI
jgi:hypothetical protein